MASGLTPESLMAFARSLMCSPPCSGAASLPVSPMTTSVTACLVPSVWTFALMGYGTQIGGGAAAATAAVAMTMVKRRNLHIDLTPDSQSEDDTPPRRRVAAHFLVSRVAQVLHFDERREVLAVMLHVRVDGGVAAIDDPRERRDRQQILARAAALDGNV